MTIRRLSVTTAFVSLTCSLPLLLNWCSAAEPLPGTKPLTIEQPLDVVMVDGIDRFALREIAASVKQREAHWKRDYSSPEAYEKSVAANREHLRTILGAVDKRAPAKAIELVGTNFQPALVARGPHYNVLAVRWQVLD